MRSWIAPRITDSSMRARCEPRQRWKPLANAMWRLAARSKSTVTASSKPSPSLIGVAGQPVDHARQRRGDGVEAGEHEQERDVDDVLAREGLAVDLGGEEPADQVVARLPAR